MPLREQEKARLPTELSQLSERGYDDRSYCHDQFLIAFDALGEESRFEVAEALKEVIIDYNRYPPDHPDMHWVEGESCWQLRVKRDHTDHRIYIDWSREDPIPTILSLLHADQTH